jgi:methoxymalonate biosynthesis protein
VLLLEYHRTVWHLKLLATSCRVVSFGAGAVILGWLIDQAAQAGVHLAADFRSTERNRMMEIAYRFAGFTGGSCACAAGLSRAPEPGVQCLHLVPLRRDLPTTMRLISPDLALDNVLDRSGSVLLPTAGSPMSRRPLSLRDTGCAVPSAYWPAVLRFFSFLTSLTIK